MNEMRKKTSETSILARVLSPEQGKLPVGVARTILKFQFPDEDQARIHDLLVRNQDDELNQSEREELERYLRIGHFLDLLRAWARHSLTKRRRTV